MANVITWRNVAAPNLANSVSAVGNAGQGIGNAFQELSEATVGYADDRQQQDTDAFLTELNAQPDEESRQNLIQQANTAFLDLGKVNAANRVATQDDQVAQEAINLESHRDAQDTLGQDQLDVTKLRAEQSLAAEQSQAANAEAARREQRILFGQQTKTHNERYSPENIERRRQAGIHTDRANSEKTRQEAQRVTLLGQDKNYSKFRRKPGSTPALQLDNLNSVGAFNTANGLPPLSTKMQKAYNRLLNTSTINAESVYNSIPGIVQNEFSVSNQQALNTALADQFRGEYTLAEEPAIQDAVSKSIAKSTLPVQFKKTAKAVKLKIGLNDQLAAATLAKGAARKDVIVAAKADVTNASANFLESKLGDKIHSADINASVKVFTDQIQSGLNWGSRDSADKDKINVAIYDVLSAATDEASRDDTLPFDRPDLVLSHVSANTDIAEYSKLEAFQAFTRGLVASPLKTDVDNLIKKLDEARTLNRNYGGTTPTTELSGP